MSTVSAPTGPMWPITKKRFKEICAWCEANLIITDVEMGQRYPLNWNQVQRDFITDAASLRLHPVMDVTVKPRQVGSSVGLLCIIIGIAIHCDGVAITWVARDEGGVEKIQKKFRPIWNSVAYHPDTPKALHNNPQVLDLANGSTISWESAGATPNAAAGAGRSDTINLVIYSELSTWAYPGITLAAIRPAVKKMRGGEFIDSTAPEMEGLGGAYLEAVRDVRTGRRPGTVIFHPWWVAPDYRLDEAALGPYTDEEVLLMRRHGLDLHQIAWRRQQIADSAIGPKFQWIYPETLELALEPKGARAFSPAVIKRLGQHALLDTWPQPLSPEILADRLDRHTARANYPHLLDQQITRIYRLPELDTPKNVRRLRSTRPPGRGASPRDAMKRLLRVDDRLTPRERFHAGLDTSDGGPESDNQALCIVDMAGDICALVRCCMAPWLLAGLVAEVMWLFGFPDLDVETNHGEAIRGYLSEAQSRETVDIRRASLRLVEPIPNVHAFNMNKKTRPEVEEAAISLLDGLVHPMSPWLFEEMLDWDPVLRKAKNGRDDCFDAFGIAQRRRERWIKIHRNAHAEGPERMFGAERFRTAF